MKLDQLQDKQIVKYRLGRAGKYNVEWGSWITGPIYVMRREKDFKRGNTFYPKGQIITLTPVNEIFAEFSEMQDISFENGNAIFVAEDYYMEIEDLEK